MLYNLCLLSIQQHMYMSDFCEDFGINLKLEMMNPLRMIGQCINSATPIVTARIASAFVLNDVKFLVSYG